MHLSECRKFNSFIGKVFGVIFRSDRRGCIERIRTVGAEAFAAENPLEREKLLDYGRWTKLEELELGHRFDFDVLCAYKLKLEILLKWKARSADQAAGNLDLAAAGVRKEKEAV